MPKLRVIRVLEYTVTCATVAQGKRILDHDFEKRYVKGIRGVDLGPKTIKELALTVIYEDMDYGQTYRNNPNVQGEVESSDRQECSPGTTSSSGSDPRPAE